MSCDIDFKQVVFLGASVRGFSASLGWNEQPTVVTVELVEDPCTPEAGTKVWYDPFTKSPIEYDLPDPGYIAPNIGSPCFFKYGEFEFTGLLSTIRRGGINTDKKLYTLTLVSPIELLQGTQVILSDYAGDVSQHNVFNVYGALEKLHGTACDTFTQDPVDGPIFGSTAGGYGGSGITSAGLPWTKVRDAIIQLTSLTPRPASLEPFSQYGRITFVGGGAGGFGLLPADFLSLSEYSLDLTELPISTVDLRIPGQAADILTIINQVCQELAHDYFVDLQYVSGFKVIKFRTVSRVNQPPTGQIAAFIDNLSATTALINADYGQELRNETGSRMLIGGQKRSMYQVNNGVPLSGADPDSDYIDTNFGGSQYLKDTVVPYYGKDALGNIYYVIDQSLTYNGKDEDGQTVAKVVDLSYIPVNMVAVKQSLNVLGPLIPDLLNVRVKEIQRASDFSTWLSFVTMSAQAPIESALGKIITDNLPFLQGDHDRAKLQAVGAKPMDVVPTFRGFDLKQGWEDLKRLFAFFNQMNESAQSTLMVRIPYTCAKLNSESQEIGNDVVTELITSDQPAPGGWTETPAILSLPNPSGIIDYFKNDDGTIPPLASYSFDENKLDLSALGDSKYYYSIDQGNSVLYVQGSVQESIEFLNRNTATSPRVLLKVPNLKNIIGLDASEEFNKLAAELEIKFRLGEDVSEDEMKAVMSVAPADIPPEPIAVAIPFVSNEITYGPWNPTTTIESPGRTDIQKDDTLVPWTYGSYSNMNTVALAKANASVSNMRLSENGSVTVPAAPIISLGKSIQNLGPNLTSINFRIDAQGGFSTTYSFKTYAHRFGILSKYNANQIGERLTKLNRFYARERFKDKVSSTQTANLKRIGGGKTNQRSDSRKSPEKDLFEEVSQNIMVGSVSNHSEKRVVGSGENAVVTSISAKRPAAAKKSLQAISNDTSNSGYNSKAIMSEDGFFRPVSLTGGGGLPRMASPKDTSATYDSETGPSKLTNKFLNFLANPEDTSGMHTGDSGHDIQVLARRDYSFFTGQTGPNKSYSLVMPNNYTGSETPGTDYTEDYRFFALRGPLMMQGWGYDTDGKPIPNEADNEDAIAASGVFESENLTNRFYPDWLQKSNTWPVAPIDLRYDRERGVWAGPGGNGASTNIKKVLVYDSTTSTSRSNGELGVPNTVRCLELSQTTTTGTNARTFYTTNPSQGFIRAEPAFGVQVSLETESCCDADGDSSGVSLDGITIDYPTAGGPDNMMFETETDVVISGRNASPASTVTVTIGGITGIPTTIDANGNWTTASIDMSATTDGAVLVTATETDIDSNVLPARKAVFNKQTDYTTEEKSHYALFTPTPTSPPQLFPASENGISTSTPSFVVKNPLPSNDALGPFPRIYVDGVQVTTDNNNQWSISDIISLSGLSVGTHWITSTVCINDIQIPTNGSDSIVESGHSPPYVLKVVAPADLPAQDGGGQITAVAQATNSSPAGEADADLITVQNVVITNPTDITTPAAPTTVPQPFPAISVTAGEALSLVYESSAWKLKEPDGKCKEGLVANFDGKDHLILISPCSVGRTIAEQRALDNDV